MITIKNMKEMPKSCRKCPFFINYCCQPDDQKHFDGYCKLLGSTIEYAAYSVRYPRCPLKEVKEPNLTDEEILDAIFDDFCTHLVDGESDLCCVNDVDFVNHSCNHNINSTVRISFTDGSSIIYCRNLEEV